METLTWQDQRVFAFWLKEKHQSIPWYLFLWKNRFTRFFFMLLSISVCTAVVYSWQPFSAMLFAEGVYGWRCSDDEIAQHKAKIITDPEAAYKQICSSQNNVIQSLYTINMSTEFVLGTVAGLSLDYLGPLLTGVVGQVLILVGVLSLALASAAHSGLYILAMVLLGGGCNFLVFPAIAMADYFPGHHALIASLVIGCQNGSTVITSILDIIYRHNEELTLRSLFLSYLFFVLFPLCICYILSCPLIRPALNSRFIQTIPTDPPTGDAPMDDAVKETSKTSPDGMTVDDGTLNRVSTNDQSPIDESPIDSIESHSSQKTVQSSRTALQDLMTVEIFLFGVFTLITVLQFNYYPTILRDLSGDAVARFNGYIIPTQAIWGVIYGLIVDRVGTLPVCHSLLVMIAIVYSLCLIQSRALQYVTTTIFVLAGTFIYTVKFTFVQGFLLGILSLLGGLTVLINIPIHNLSDSTPVIIAMLASTSVCFVTIIVLQIRKRRGVNHFGVDPKAPSTTAGIELATKGDGVELV